jgi:hypothetical protein
MASGSRRQRLNVATDHLARQWLRENGYADIDAVIEKIIDDWKASGKKTRPNWWEMLAGDSQGRPRRLGEHEFSILKSVQIRQGLPVTPNAIQREEEKAASAQATPNRSMDTTSAAISESSDGTKTGAVSKEDDHWSNGRRWKDCSMTPSVSGRHVPEFSGACSSSAR